jgi:predicted metal-dependent hydrolase
MSSVWDDAVPYGTNTIHYRVEYRDRKTLAIEVHSGGSVFIKAPQGTDVEQIRERVSKRGSWILKQQRIFQQYPPSLPEREFVPGETFRYLGRQYRLKVLQGDEERVRLWCGRLEATVKDVQDKQRVKRLVQGWFRERASIIFKERYLHCLTIARQHGITHDSGFKLRWMPKRWGSCTLEGRISLNPSLIAAPKDAVDYVILHEICHVKIKNHSQDFYQLLAQVLPGWQELRYKLNTDTELTRI